MHPLDRFEYSQSSLQDYVDCRRRFQLRYIERVAWPAVQAEPARENERHMQRGQRFHRLAQQYLLGVPETYLARMAEADEDENLLHWWQNFMACVPGELVGTRHVEVSLQIPVNGQRLIAVYDLVLVRPDGGLVIFDWKTSPRRPRREKLLDRLQTRIYPFILTQAGAALTGGREVQPEQVRMIYWFTEPGQAPEVLDYSLARCQSDEQNLRQLIAEIRGLKGDEFGMTRSESACRFCVYRSLCGRGEQAADMAADESYEPGDGSDGLDFDLENIGEIRF